MQFGDDWRGVFIRGDDAHAYAAALGAIIQNSSDVFANAVLLGLKDLLLRSDESQADSDTQKLRSFDVCKI